MAAEGNIVGEVGLIVKPVDPGFNAGVKKIIDKIERDAQFKVAADTQQAQAALNGLDSQIGAINNGLVQSAINVAGITAAFYALKGAANQVIGKFSGLFDQLAQAKAGFSSILKSENAGNNLLDQIREFARVSPFVTQELVNYSQQLLGVGLSAQRIVPLLEDVGNIISSVGGDTQNMGRVLFTLTQIQSIGRLAGQDAMQLQSALIPITKYLSEYMGKTTAEVKKLQEQGKISADTVFAAISSQGDKVSGAMAKATRNIAGARAILGDTITIMLQNQPVLNKVFEDIYKGILAFSDYLSQDNVTQAIGEFFDGVDKIYEGLKPLIEAISEFSSSTGLGVLNSLASILTGIGVALSAIPEGVYKAFGLFLVTLSTLKAPMMLIKYVTNFKNLTVGALTAGVSIKRVADTMDQQTAAAQRAAAATEGLAVANDKVAKSGMLVSLRGKAGQAGQALQSKFASGTGSTVAGLALATAGSAISDGEGGMRDSIGTLAQYTGMGAAVGGPWGAVAGAGIGAFVAITTASRKAAAEIKKHAMEAAAAWSDELQKQIEARNGGVGQGDSLEQFLSEADKAQGRLDAYNRLKNKYQQEQLSYEESMANYTASNEVYDRYDELTGKLKNVDEVLKQAKLDQDALFKDGAFIDYLKRAADALALVAAANPDLTEPGKFLGFAGQRQGMTVSPRVREIVGGQDIPRTTAELELVNKELASIGLTFDDLTSKTATELDAIVKTFTQLPDAIRDALKATNEWNTKLTEAKATAETMWGPEQKKLQAIIGYNNSLTGAFDAQTKAAYNLKDVNAQLSAQTQILALKEQAYAIARANGASEAQAMADADRAAAAAAKFHADAIEAAEASTNLQRESTVNQLLKLSGIADTLDNRQLIIDVALSGVQEVLTQIEDVRTKLLGLKNEKGLPDAERRDLQSQYNGQLAELQKKLDELGAGGGQALVDKIKAEEEKRNGDTRRKEAEDAAKKAAEDAKRAAEQWASAVEQATTSMTSAVQSAAEMIAEAAKSWVGSIKERTQYEQAVSASRLARNANRQIADVAELQAGIQNLKSRGLSQGMLDALGIDNVSDTRQVRKLVRASDSDLAALAASMSGLDTAATALAQQQEDKRQRDNITMAILEAAKQLDINIGKEQAAGISNSFTITPTNPEDVALQILNILTSGRISA